ncbi:hypothetical protein ACWDY7_26730 [Streptomyces calvus]|uniref:Uncharacterized protein n=1 Tax=Streptomyces calvus TaxID=67282 RepID=A0AA40VGE6_9ACTN|nr:hypothetical protein [Streptomyces calvus]MBA8942725.1 hypothetical protein [Streptomyces calvus]
MVLAEDGLRVCHRDKRGVIRNYDFGALPVAPALQRSFAAVFAARCAPGGGWDSAITGFNIWVLLRAFAKFLSEQESPPGDVDEFTAALWSSWRLSRPATDTGYRQVKVLANFLLRDERLPEPVREVMAKRVLKVKAQERAYQPEEFAEIRVTARRMFRAALLRIRENTRHLDAWRKGAFEPGSRDWLIGEGLDCLARTGHVPRYQQARGKMVMVNRYRLAMGGARPEVTWQRLYLSRIESTSLAVLLVTEQGLNATTVSEMPVPRATPDSGQNGGFPVYRLELEKRRRGGGRHFETRNLTDFGADSPGRLITEALEATAHARAFIAASGSDLDRLLIWHETYANSGRADPESPRVGPFVLGLARSAGTHWAIEVGLAGSPLRRTRKTVNVLHRREPGQNTQDTHDRVYVMNEPQAQEAAVPVIADGATAALDAARRTVFRAQLSDGPEDSEQQTATAGCTDYDNSPFTPPGSGCGASFLLCTACPNARVHPGHHARLAYLHHALESLRTALEPGHWETDWSDAHARLEDLKSRLGVALWTAKLAEVTSEDREAIDHLLNGHYDL